MREFIITHIVIAEELERKKVDDLEQIQRQQIHEFNLNQVKRILPKTIDEKIAFLRQRSARYNHQYPSMDPDYPHACKECFCYRVILHFGYIDFRNRISTDLNFSDNVEIVGSICHICDFNYSTDIGVRHNTCSYFRLRKIDDFERYLLQLLDYCKNK